MNSELKMGVISLLEEVLRDPDLLPQERKATTNILRYPSIHLFRLKHYEFFWLNMNSLCRCLWDYLSI